MRRRLAVSFALVLAFAASAHGAHAATASAHAAPGAHAHAASTARAASPAPAPAAALALPDTGLFAPVAHQLAAWTAHIATLEAAGTPTAERVRLLLLAGRTDAAAALATKLDTEQPDNAVACGRAWLAVQNFARVATLVARIARTASPGPGERALQLEWLFERNDGAAVDSLTRGVDRPVELLAAGRVALERLDAARADSCFRRALAESQGDETRARFARSAALTGLALVEEQHRDWDGALATARQALATHATPEALMALNEALIRMGRSDEAVSAAEWAATLAPYHDSNEYQSAHYRLGNGFTRRNYTQLAAAYPRAFAGAAGRKALAQADALLAAGRRVAARAAYGAVIAQHAGWVDARIRLASLDFEDGRFADATAGCFAALAVVPEYGRAHAILAKSLEGARYTVDVHREACEARFAAAPLPALPGIEKFVLDWKSLSARHQKRVALSLAPWQSYLPVMLAAGATLDIKPMWQRLSEAPDMESMRDQRISYDSRLWDDVRGAGGFHTVTGIEDVERTIFDQYNTVLHEHTHQVQYVLPADDVRKLNELYARAKHRDDSTHAGFLSRYASGAEEEYFAEGANALESPMQDAYDAREIVRERLDRIDPDLRREVEALMARTDVSASYPVAWAAGGDDCIERGRVAEALPLYRRAMERDSTDETVLLAYSRALLLAGQANDAFARANTAATLHRASGAPWVATAEAMWHTGALPQAALVPLRAGRAQVSAGDRHLVDAELGRLSLVIGDAPTALAAYDSVLAHQSDDPDGLAGRAEALALARRFDDAIAQYESAVRMRTGVADLRCAYARDLLRAGRVDAARAQLEAAKLLDERNAEAEALRAWADLESGALDAARTHAKQALAWGPWCDLASIVTGGIEAKSGHADAARAAWAPVRERIAKSTPPSFVYRPELATWVEVHALPAAERELLDAFTAH